MKLQLFLLFVIISLINCQDSSEDESIDDSFLTTLRPSRIPKGRRRKQPSDSEQAEDLSSPISYQLPSYQPAYSPVPYSYPQPPCPYQNQRSPCGAQSPCGNSYPCQFSPPPIPVADSINIPRPLPQIPAPRPQPINPLTNKPVPPEQEIITRCPEGTFQNGSHCVPQHEIQCPSGHVWNANDYRCVLSKIICPVNYEWDGKKCVQRQVCPPNYYWKNGRCILPDPECPRDTRWNGFRCEVVYKSCPHPFVLRNDECVEEKISCPIGHNMVNGECVKPLPLCQSNFEYNYETGFCEKVRLKCKEGTELINGKCQSNERTCPQGYQLINGLCYENPRPTLPPVIVPPENIVKPTYAPLPLPTYPPQVPKVCNEGFSYYEGQCYRCPNDYNFCNGGCSQEPSCGNNPSINYPYPPVNYPSQPNININIKPGEYGRSAALQSPVNIVNTIEPMNNTIININNITHPITLNNNNENNIYIYTETQCSDGTIRATIVKNNETTTSCVESDTSNIPERSMKNEKCCDVVTPRQCKKRYGNQWMCTHKRYKHCGNACVDSRVFMRPQANTYQNQVLTMAPLTSGRSAQPYYGNNFVGKRK